MGCAVQALGFLLGPVGQAVLDMVGLLDRRPGLKRNPLDTGLGKDRAVGPQYLQDSCHVCSQHLC